MGKEKTRKLVFCCCFFNAKEDKEDSDLRTEII